MLGNLLGGAQAALEIARRDAGFDVTHVSRTDEAIDQLDRAPWRAVLVDLTTPGASRLCHEARARQALFNVPLVALSPKLTDLAFSNAFRWGADDVVRLGAAEPLAARLRAVPAEPIPRIDPSRGKAVIADPERGRCDVVGRVLSNAGYEVVYATDATSARDYARKPSVELFVLNADLTDPVRLLDEARLIGSEARWVLTTKQRNVPRLRSELGGQQHVLVMSSHGPPENILFAINLLSPPSAEGARAEVRALHGSVVLFRAVGEERDEHGFTYSVSATGLYIRSVLPPPAEELWLELQPPNIARRVRLQARVAWNRGFGKAGAETAPPGFGLRILGGLGNDQEIWLEGFRSLDIRNTEPHELPELRSTSGAFRLPLPSSRPPTPAEQAVAGSRSLAAAVELRPRMVPPARIEVASEPVISDAPDSPVEAAKSSAADDAAQLEPHEIPTDELISEPLQPRPARSGGTVLGLGDIDLTAEAPPATHAVRAEAPRDSTEFLDSDLLTTPTDLSVSQPIEALQPPPLVGDDRPSASDSPTLPQIDPEQSPSEPAPAVGSTQPPDNTERSSPARWGWLAAVLLTVAGALIFAVRMPKDAPTASQRYSPEATSLTPAGSGTNQPRTSSGAKEPAAAAVSELTPPADAIESPTSPTPEARSAPAVSSQPAAFPSEATPSVVTSAASTAPAGAAPKDASDTPPTDPATLPADQGYLLVKSAADARVFVHGIDAGPTNAWLRSKCGTRFIRLGSAPGEWVSRGIARRVRCRSSTQLELDGE